MHEPKLEPAGSGYRVAFWAPMVSFDFQRIRERGGEVTAELAVTKQFPDPTTDAVGHLFSCRLRMLSLSDQGSVVTALRSEMKDVEWRTLLNKAIHLVLTAHRATQAPLLLRDAQKPAGSGLLLPFALGRHPVVLFGDGGSLKSWLLLAAAAAIQAGTSSPIGHRPAEQANVAFLDWELDDYEHRERLSMLVGDQMPGIVYQRLHRPLVDEVDTVQDLIAEHDIGYLIVDSAGFACDGPPEEAQAALGFYSALRQFNVGALVAAHINRTGDTERPFGSIFWHNGARMTWYVKAQKDTTGDQVAVGLYCRKSNLRRPSLPLGFRFTFSDGDVQIQRTDVRDVPELAGQVSLKWRIQHLLGDGLPRDYPEIAESLDADLATVRQTVKRELGKLFVKLDDSADRVRIALLHLGETDVTRHAVTSVTGSLRDKSVDPLLGGALVTAPLFGMRE